jgi:hypothetical protein
MNPSTYPVNFSVDYPDHQLNRMTTFLRILIAIPILAVAAALTHAAVLGSGRDAAVSTGGTVFAATVLMLLFRRKYPRWWFDWNLELQRFSSRIGVYLALMDDQYPSTDDYQSVHLDFPYPNAETDLNRWLPLIKWLLALPHYLILVVLYIAAILGVIMAWFAILVTGTYPRWVFEFVESVMRWSVRVTAYAFILVTDEYPPFRFSP